MKEVTIISKATPSKPRSGNYPAGASVVYGGGQTSSVDLSGKLDKTTWERNFEEKTDPNDTDYLYITKPVVLAAGFTMHSGDAVNVPSIFAGLPIDDETLYWEDGILKSKAGGLNSVTVNLGNVAYNSVDGIVSLPAYPTLSGYATESWVNSKEFLTSASLSGYATESWIANKGYLQATDADKTNWNAAFGWGDHSLSGYAKADSLKDYVTLSTAQDVSGIKNFTHGIKINGKRLYEEDGVIYLDGDLAVSGGIVMNALAGRSISTIMDGVLVDGVTIIKEDNVLKVVGGGGGSGSVNSIKWLDTTYMPDGAGAITLPDVCVKKSGDVMTGKLTTQGSARRISLNPLYGNVYFHSTDNAYATGLYWRDSADLVDIASIGIYGNNTSVNYAYIGASYDNTWQTWSSEKSHVSVHFEAPKFAADVSGVYVQASLYLPDSATSYSATARPRIGRFDRGAGATVLQLGTANTFEIIDKDWQRVLFELNYNANASLLTLNYNKGITPLTLSTNADESSIYYISTSPYRYATGIGCWSNLDTWVVGNYTGGTIGAKFIVTPTLGTLYAGTTNNLIWHAGNFGKNSLWAGDSAMNHGVQANVFTPYTFMSNFLNNTWAGLARRGSWDYANNGQLSTDWGNIHLAGTAYMAWGVDENRTMLFITPSTNNIGQGLVNEMLFYTSDAPHAVYPSAWTRVLTSRNYNSYSPTLTGGGASGTWGISISGTAANANTLEGINEYLFVRDRHIGGKYDYQNTVILLWKDSDITNHRIVGKLFTDGGGGNRWQFVDINIWHSRWAAGGIGSSSDYNFSLTTTYQGNSWRLVTCTYGGATWWALQHTNIQAVSFYFQGTYKNVSWTPIVYYTQNTGTINNSEINGSITNRDNYVSTLIKGGSVLYATTIDNVASATKLQTARSIFGNMFDGTSNVIQTFTMRYSDSANGEAIHKILNYDSAPYGLLTRIYTNGAVSLQSQRESNNSEVFNLLLNPLGGNVSIGTIVPSSYRLHVAGDIYANGGWLRSSGTTGWYNETYSGGIYMSDSTWVQTFNKAFYCGHSAAIGSNGFNVNIKAESAGHAGIEVSSGSYTMGLGCHSNGSWYWWRGTAAGKGYCMQYNGSTWDFTGNIIATGGVTMNYTSDRTLKQNIRLVTDASKRLMSLGGIYDFAYIDEEVQKNPTYAGEHIGLIYQNVKDTSMSRMCHQRKDGKGTINYIEPGFISLLAAVGMEHETRLQKLERENRTLKRRINILERRLA